MADSETTKAFRQLEKELDTNHQGLPFFTVPTSRAAYSLLAAFDGFYIVDAAIFAAMSGEIDIGSTQLRKKFEDGLSQALRWMVKDPSTFDSAPTNDPSTINEAGEFIRHAGDYYNLADFHAMFGRGLLDVSVDLKDKKVRFIAPPNQTVQQAMMGYAEIVENLKNLPFVRRPQDIERLERQASRAMRALDHEFIDGRVVLKNTNQLADPTIIAFCESFRHEFVDIDPNVDLGGFTIDQFQRYWSVLARWSHSATGIFFERVQSGVPQNECMPTQCVPKADFFSSVRNLSGLDEDTVSLITDCRPPT